MGLGKWPADRSDPSGAAIKSRPLADHAEPAQEQKSFCFFFFRKRRILSIFSTIQQTFRLTNEI
jgi:hypothetical protein